MRLVCDFSFFLEGFEGGRVSGQGWGGPLAGELRLCLRRMEWWDSKSFIGFCFFFWFVKSFADVSIIAGNDQVHHLEDLKRKCWKREKKAKGRATGVAAIWKVKTWGGAGAGAKGKAEDSSAAFVEEPESAVEEDEVEDEEDEEVSCRRTLHSNSPYLAA